MAKLEILKGVEIVDLALFTHNTLAITDVHIGYEEALNKQGFLIPRFQFKEIMKRLENIFNKLNSKKIERVIINGDLKHEFGTISIQEWRHTLQLIDFLSKHAKEIILIKGTHDTILGPIARKRNIKLVNSYVLKDLLFIHGDNLPKAIPKNIKTIIIGHEHPAISLKDGPRVEIFKCFLKGKWKKYNLIVMPSFNLVAEGTDILKEKILSPFLQQDLSNFEVYVVADGVRYFGRVKGLKWKI